MADHRRLSQRVQALLALGVLAVPASVGTFAFWTDDVTVTGTTFTAGTLDLRVNGLDTVTSYTTMNLTTMVPGNSVAGVLTVRNNGTAPLKYTAVTAATNADTKNLRGALVVKVTGDTAVTGSSPAATCAGTALSGTSTALNGGLVTTGRLLAAATEEKLCVQVTLPTGAASSLQGATTDVTFTFTGTSDLT
jgi:predicted ribosomally synthesized peptide with SipW-like signal peptide